MNRKQPEVHAKSLSAPSRDATATAAQRYAVALRHHHAGHLVEAERDYRQVLALNARHADALHMLGVIAYQVGRNDIAVDLIETAIGIDDKSAPYHCNLGSAFKGLGRYDAALRAYDTAISLAPDYAEAHSNLGTCFKELGRLDDAIQAYLISVSLKPDDAAAHFNLGIALTALGRFADAVRACKTAIRITRDLALAHSNLGIALKSIGCVDDAIDAYKAAIGVKPDYAEAYSNLGGALSERGRFDDAIAAYNTAINLKRDFADAYYGLGIALKKLRRLDDAIEASIIVLRLKPDHAEAHASLGSIFAELGRFDDAVEAYDTAIRLKPDRAEAYSNLGIALMELERFDRAVLMFKTAIAQKPDLAEGYSNLGAVLTDLGRLGDAIDAYQTAIHLKPDSAEAHSNLLMSLHYQPHIGEDMILATARRFAARYEGDRPASPAFTNAPDPERRLRIGYVSGDFRRHPVGYFLSKVLRNHTRAAVEVHCYSNHTRSDELTAQLRGHADRWRTLVGMSDGEAASMIAADGIDILVDLAGHTARNRLPLFARKPAPVQVSWLGFWGTTGVSGMDYILSDLVTIPLGEECHYSEQVMRLPAGRFCYEPPDYAPPPSMPPSLRGAALTFGSFNNVTKVGPDVVRLWADVLKAVPGSRMLLKWKTLADEGLRTRLLQDFAAVGIAAGRLEFRAESPHAAMLAEYGDIDIVLDPFPFTGGLSSCEALWMGVPIVTLPGSRAPSRQTLGFLQALGLTEWAAASESDYVRIAVDLASDRERRVEIRSGLRERFAASPLCDGAGFTSALECAYRAMWRDWCAGLPKP